MGTEPRTFVASGAEMSPFGSSFPRPQVKIHSLSAALTLQDQDAHNHAENWINRVLIYKRAPVCLMANSTGGAEAVDPLQEVAIWLQKVTSRSRDLDFPRINKLALTPPVENTSLERGVFGLIPLP